MPPGEQKKEEHVGRRARRIKERVHKKKVAQQRRAVEEAAQEEKRKAERAAKLAEQRRLLEGSVEKQADAKHTAMLDAKSRRAARLIDVQRQELYVAYLSRGRKPPANEFDEARLLSFRARLGRDPTSEEQEQPPQLADEQEQLRVSRHELAEAALAVIEAKRLIMLKQRAAAQKSVQEFEREHRRAGGHGGGAATGAVAAPRGRGGSVRTNPLYEVVDEHERGLKRLERRRRRVRDLEQAWPGHHWQRDLQRIRLPVDPAEEAAAARQREEEERAAADAGWNI